jgi:hypothetical protein
MQETWPTKEEIEEAMSAPPHKLGFGLHIPVEEGGINWNHPDIPKDVWRVGYARFLKRLAAA